MLMNKNVNSYMYLDLKGLFPDACIQSTLSRFLDFLRLDETLFNIGSPWDVFDWCTGVRYDGSY